MIRFLSGVQNEIRINSALAQTAEQWWRSRSKLHPPALPAAVFLVRQRFVARTTQYRQARILGEARIGCGALTEVEGGPAVGEDPPHETALTAKANRRCCTLIVPAAHQIKNTACLRNRAQRKCLRAVNGTTWRSLIEKPEEKLTKNQ